MCSGEGARRCPGWGSRGSVCSGELAERGHKPAASKASVGIGVAGGELRG
jgi:hypothetical protein